MQHPGSCCDFIQLLQTYPDNNVAPKVVLLYLVNCMIAVSGHTINCQRAAGSVLRTWCRQWRSNHGVHNYFNNKAYYCEIKLAR